MGRVPKYLGLIPARGGSKGIPRKNMVRLGDQPLLQYTVEAALGSQRLERIFFTSDDQEMIDFVRRLGVEAPFQRPAELATDTASTVDVVLHALSWLEREQAYRPEAVVLLQPTCPFRDAADIDAAIATYEASGRETLISVSPALQHPCELVTVQGERLVWAVEHPAPGQGGRQTFPDYYFIDGAIHVVTPRFLRERRRFIDENSAIHIIERSHGLDIDKPYQLQLARGLLLIQAQS